MNLKQTNNIKAARRASLLIFLVCGIGLSAWAPMVPFVKTNLGLDDAMLGVILLALGAGAIVTMPFTGFLINSYGSRRVILAAAVIIAVTLPLLLLAPRPWLLSLVLFLFGAGIGAIDVAMNSQAVIVQDRFGTHIMSSFHGMFSLGGLIGALGLGLLIRIGLSPVVAAWGIAVLLLLIVSTQYRFLLPHAEEPTVDSFSFTMPRGPVLSLGLMAFVFFLAEGAMLDWSAVFLQFHRNFDPSLSGAGYALFSVAMAVMRLTGDGVVQRLGERKVVIYGALLSAAGYLLAVCLPHTGATLLGFVLVGLGAANVVPVFFSAAGKIPGVAPSIALPAVSTLGYAGQLAGPALIGFAADLTSLPVALGGVSVLLLWVGAAHRRSR